MEGLGQFSPEELRAELCRRESKLDPSESKEALFEAKTSEFESQDVNLAVETTEKIFNALHAMQETIYGEDDRIDVVQLGSEHADRINSVGIVVPLSALTKHDTGEIEIKAQTLAEAEATANESVCLDEPFRDQPVLPSRGTAFLVGPDLIVTANHVLNVANFGRYVVVFGFDAEQDGAARTKFHPEQIVSFKRVVKSSSTGTGNDWSIVELERARLGPYLVMQDGPVPDQGTKLYVIGHPRGLPKKFADNAEVWSKSGESFIANIDTYAGNSGSPVFNAETNEVVGILLGGARDFVSRGGCIASLVCSEASCSGETCTHIGVLKQHFYINA